MFILHWISYNMVYLESSSDVKIQLFLHLRKHFPYHCVCILGCWILSQNPGPILLGEFSGIEQ